MRVRVPLFHVCEHPCAYAVLVLISQVFTSLKSVTLQLHEQVSYTVQWDYEQLVKLRSRRTEIKMLID